MATAPLFFHAQGPEDAPALLILHGVFGSSDNWRTLAGRMAAHYRVYAIDQRNHGRSPHLPEMNYALLAQDVLRLMDDQGLAHATVLGHSMGGKTAMRLALDHPDRVAALISADMSPRSYPPHHNAIIRALRQVPVEELRRRNEADEVLAQYIAEVPIRQFLMKNLYRPEAGGFAWRFNLDAIEANYAGLMHELSGGTYPGPTLFLAGEKSGYITPSEDGALIRRLFPQAQFDVVAGAGHWLHAENPEGFLHAMGRFLDVSFDE